MIHKNSIALSKVGFSPLTVDYLNGESKLKPFYNHNPDLASFAKQIEEKKQKLNRKVLVAALLNQYESASINDTAIIEQIKTLERDNTFTVCTGHQLNIYTGPLYFIYKILSAIKLSQALKHEYTNHHFVPVYWMASEDHDFEEISHVKIFSKNYQWNTESGQAVGSISTESLADINKEIIAVLGNSEHAQRLGEILEKAYGQAYRLDKASRILVHELFKAYGLVIVDGNHPDLKASFNTIMQDDLTAHNAYKLVSETIEKLNSLHYKPQVKPREINLFSLAGEKRERILPEQASDFADGSKSHELSPNVVLRPLYQEFILPNLAYIGGPAEVAYWLEFKNMFNFYQIPFPIVLLRNCAWWIDENSKSKLQKFDLQAEDLLNDLALVHKKYLQGKDINSINFETEHAELVNIYKALSEKIGTLENTLKASVDAEMNKTLGGLKALESKVLKAIKAKHENELQQITNLREKLMPNGVLQERADNFIPFYLKYGPGWFDNLLENFEPIAKSFSILSE